METAPATFGQLSAEKALVLLQAGACRWGMAAEALHSSLRRLFCERMLSLRNEILATSNCAISFFQLCEFVSQHESNMLCLPFRLPGSALKSRVILPSARCTGCIVMEADSNVDQDWHL